MDELKGKVGFYSKQKGDFRVHTGTKGGPLAPSSFYPTAVGDNERQGEGGAH